MLWNGTLYAKPREATRFLLPQSLKRLQIPQPWYHYFADARLNQRLVMRAEAKPNPTTTNTMSNAHTNGKSCTVKQDNTQNTTGEVYTSPTLVFDKTMLTHANTISVVLVLTTVSNNEYSHNMDDSETQVFSGRAKFISCLQEIVRKGELFRSHPSSTQNHFWRITCIQKEGMRNYDVNCFADFMSLVALEIGTLIMEQDKSLDSWWRSKDNHGEKQLEIFSKQLLEVPKFLSHQKFLNELEKHEKTQSE